MLWYFFLLFTIFEWWDEERSHTHLWNAINYNISYSLSAGRVVLPLRCGPRNHQAPTSTFRKKKSWSNFFSQFENSTFPEGWLWSRDGLVPSGDWPRWKGRCQLYGRRNVLLILPAIARSRAKSKIQFSQDIWFCLTCWLKWFGKASETQFLNYSFYTVQGINNESDRCALVWGSMCVLCTVCTCGGMGQCQCLSLSLTNIFVS